MKATPFVDFRESHFRDKVTQAAAVQFCEKHALTFGGPPKGVAGWALVEGQSPSYTFKATAAAAGGKRPFACTVGWLAAFAPGCTLRFPTVPGLAHGLTFKLPSDESVVGKALAVTATVDAAAVKKASFTVTSLMRKVETPDFLHLPEEQRGIAEEWVAEGADARLADAAARNSLRPSDLRRELRTAEWERKELEWQQMKEANLAELAYLVRDLPHAYLARSPACITRPISMN